jgi:hypothetical protein
VYYGKRLFAGGEGLTPRDVLGMNIEPRTLDIIEGWQRSFKDGAISPLVVYEALDSIEEDLGGVPSVKLYVPIHFDVNFVEKFGTWFREEVQPNTLLTIRTDPRVAGGCAVIWKDTYYDLSLRFFMHKERTAILERFDELLHAK